MAPIKKRKKKTAQRRPLPTDMQTAWTRTRALVEAMLCVMEKEIAQPGSAPEQWDRLFGAKSSAVANLEKLVQVLIELHAQIQVQVQDGEETAPFSREEMALLGEWLKENPEITVIASVSEAIHLFSAARWIASLTLAMTGGGFQLSLE